MGGGGIGMDINGVIDGVADVSVGGAIGQRRHRQSVDGFGGGGNGRR